MRDRISEVKTFFAHILKLAVPYWQSEEKWIARALLFIITVCNLGGVFMLVLVNKWYAVFYQSLQDKDFVVFKQQLLVFAGYAAIYIVLAVYGLYLTQMLQIRWRRWLTEKYFDRWFARKVYYRMELKNRQADNPDQRIAQDVMIFTSSTLEYVFGFINAVVTLVSFVGILWTISGSIVLWGVTIPGYMVWAALIYAVVGTWITHKIGCKLVSINFNLEKYQADFRYNLVRLRENSEQIALYGGEQSEKKSLMHRFQSIWTTWWDLMRTQKRLTWFTSSYNQIAIIFPILVAAPKFFSGVIHLGILMQIVSAFGQVQTALSWFINAYPGLADWKASVDRLLTFDDYLEMEEDEMDAEKGILTQVSEKKDVQIEMGELNLPNGDALFKDVSLDFKAGESVLITGESGCGKSTFLRSIAGIWPFGAGVVKRPQGSFMFLPQKAYLPIDSLKNILAFPNSGETLSETRAEKVLDEMKLSHLKPFLNEEKNWAQYLSGGEQQRFAFARVFLNEPDWLFMDEATSAMDPELEIYLFDLLKSRFPEMTIVTVSHHESLKSYHDRIMTFERDGRLAKIST